MHLKITLSILKVTIQSMLMVRTLNLKRSHQSTKGRTSICTILFKTRSTICHRFSKSDSNPGIKINITSRIWLMWMSQNKGHKMLDKLDWSVLKRNWSWDATKMLTCRTILWIELHWFMVSNIRATIRTTDNTMVDITFKTMALITRLIWCLLRETV